MYYNCVALKSVLFHTEVSHCGLYLLLYKHKNSKWVAFEGDSSNVDCYLFNQFMPLMVNVRFIYLNRTQIATVQHYVNSILLWNT